MRSTWFTRAARATIALTLLSATAASSAAAGPGPERPGRRRAANLFAVTNAVLNVNRVFCGINNLGELCVDPTNSPVVGGGFWPKGTPDQYIFNSGLQLAGTIPTTAGGGKPTFAWAGDTVGAYFFDARGTQVQGDAVTLVYNSLDAGDAAAWPNGAKVRDTALYAGVLIGRDNISQQDLWTRAWDGNPAFLSGRTHPMGILVEERGLAWNFPTGNEDIIYFVFTFYNVTASNCSIYSGLSPAIQAEICQAGQNFQNRNEAVFNFNIPDGGYPISNLYASFSMDPDVGDASFDYSTAILPFNMGVAYKNDFLEPNWSFPPDIFGAPFVSSPGFVGVKYLRSPKVAGSEVGLTMFSNTRNAATGFPDPVGVIQLFRYLSGTVSPAKGDNPCTVDPIQQHMCFLDQTASDTRFFQASGPFTLGPGESQTIVVAYVHAAPLADVLPFIGGDLKPGIPAPGDTIFSDPTRVRTIERAAGWLSQADSNGDLRIQQNEVTTVKRSLLDKALVAQAVFDKKFLLPFAPDAPTFFLVPGDNRVTVVWQPSETEVVKPNGGDPFYAVASQPLNPDLTANVLYDPNFRQYDVEGYRIYRGRTTSQMELVAQFDYAGTTITDYTGAFAYNTDIGSPADPHDGGTPDGIVACAPELGVQDDCPVQFSTAYPFADSWDHDLVGEVIQVPAGGRVQLSNGAVLIVKADTLVTGNGSGFPQLASTGVGFAFVDTDVQNSFTYHYSVTAFDVNSFTSGPSSLESPRITKRVTPRRAPNTTPAVLSTAILGTDGTQLDPTLPYPDIDAATGGFLGKMPPANAGALSLVAGTELLPAGDIVVRVDSASAGTVDGIGTPPSNLYLTIIAGGDTVPKVIPMPEPGFSSTASTTWDFGVAGEALVPYDSARARAFGLQFTKDTRLPISFGGVALPMTRTSAGIATNVGRFGSFTEYDRYLAHSRWFTGNTEPPDPTIMGLPDSAHHAGALPNVSKIWAPSTYRQPLGTGVNQINERFRNYAYAQTTIYPADFLATWNADSSLTVFDSTHHSTLPYSPGGGTGWGFINVAAFTAAGLTAGNLRQGGDPVPTNLAIMTYNHLYGTRSTCTQRRIACVQLARKAAYEQLDMDHDGVADANGIGLMVNGEGFFMALPGGIPAANTRWRLRQVVGRIRATQCRGATNNILPDAALDPVMTDCTGYTFTGVALRPSLAPGLTYRVSVQSQFAIDSVTAGDLAQVHTVPDPYYVTNPLEITPTTKVLKFVNLPPRAIVRIYSVSGVLVNVLTLHDPTGGGELTWNLRNRNNQFVASGVYFYHVEGIDGRSKVGRFTVVNFAQ